MDCRAAHGGANAVAECADGGAHGSPFDIVSFDVVSVRVPFDDVPDVYSFAATDVLSFEQHTNKLPFEHNTSVVELAYVLPFRMSFKLARGWFL